MLLVRATVHLRGLNPGDPALVDGDDETVRNLLAAGFLVPIEDDADAEEPATVPVEAPESPQEPPEAPGPAPEPPPEPEPLLEPEPEAGLFLGDW